jgi:hypothetical protein
MSKVITPQENPEEHRQAMGFVQNYQNTKKENSVDAQFFNKEAMQKLIEHPDFFVAKVHHGRLEDGTRTMIFEGLNENGESLDSFIIDGVACPPHCGWPPY